ncbi:MAG: hypothetical protein AAGI07_01810 [Bacteroidota bacterium]
MTTFIKELEKFSGLEKSYHQKYPDAQPLGNFYHYFGISQMLNILNEAEGREIKFYVESNSNQCIYSFQ